jgi:predicted metal-dependent phosphotriesterase family hydrolase
MGDVFLHPVTRIKLKARLVELEVMLAQLEAGGLHLLAQPAYRATTIANARRTGLSLQQIHRIGVENARRLFEGEAADP